MSGIGHLIKDNTTRAARIDSLDTDSVNSIIERISGVNPTKLVEGDKGQGKAPPQNYGAPPSPITENFQPQQQHQMYGAPQGGQQMQEMQQRMAMLEQKVAYYEGDGVEAAAAKKNKIDQDAQTNRGTDSSAFAPNMRSKRAAKIIMKKDPADGEPDGAKAQPGGQAMPQEQTNILGISMNEWNDLIGVTTPYENPSERSQAQPSQNLSESHGGQQQEYHESDLSEGYFTEDELAEAWFGFLEDNGYDPAEFSNFVEAADEYGDEVALLAIQDLEDEFQEAVDAYMEGKETVDQYLRRGGKVKKVKPGYAANSRLDHYTVGGGGNENYRTSHSTKDGHGSSFGGSGTRKSRKAAAESTELAQEDIDEVWEMWLEDRGLSVEMFNHLIGEAIESEDQDEMDALLAVEELFNQFLESEFLRGKTAFGIKKAMADNAGKDITHLLRSKGASSSSSSSEKPVKKDAAPVSTKKRTFTGSPSGELQVASVQRMLARRIFEASVADMNRELNAPTTKSVVDKPKITAKDKTRGVNTQKTKSGADPRKWAKSWGLDDDISFDEEDGFSFSCESGDDGSPSIPMARIMKALKKRKGRK